MMFSESFDKPGWLADTNGRTWPKLVGIRKKPKKVYLRFGLWNDGRSYNWGTGERERGVSVYPAKIIDGVVHLDLSDPNLILWGSHLLEGRYVWPVTGKEVCKGSDGEPVLQGVVARYLPVAIDTAQSGGPLFSTKS